jgi:hypothetical protein
MSTVLFTTLQASRQQQLNGNNRIKTNKKRAFYKKCSFFVDW